jgi:putative flavoprotein involved in K+ transport
VDENDEASSFGPAEDFERTLVDESPPLTLDLAKAGIRTILWATGFRPDYSWLDVDVLNQKGMIRHDGGVAEAPGLYVIGLPCLRRRKSSFIHGIEDDARDLHKHLTNFLDS